MRQATFKDVFAVAEFRILFVSFALQVSGDSIKMLALSVLVFERTGSAGLSATAYMVGWLPYILGGTLLLSLADRLPPRGLMVTGELVRLAVCATLALAELPIWAMFAIVLVTGVFGPVFSAARMAMLPELLPGDAFVLGRSLMGVTSAGAQIAGMALGGGLITAVGAERALLVIAVMGLVASAVLRVGLPYRPARTARTEAGTVRTSLRVNRDLLADRRVRGLLLAQWLPVTFMAGAEAVFVPYLSGIGAGEAAGVALACAAAGMAVGEFTMGRLVRPEVRERLTTPVAAALGVPLMAFTVRPGPVLTAVLAALAGGCMAYSLGLQRRFADAVPERMRGQAFGLASAGMMTTQAVGATLVGLVAELLPPHLAVAVAGGCATLTALALGRVLRAADPSPGPSPAP